MDIPPLNEDPRGMRTRLALPTGRREECAGLFMVRPGTVHLKNPEQFHVYAAQHEQGEDQGKLAMQSRDIWELHSPSKVSSKKMVSTRA